MDSLTTWQKRTMAVLFFLGLLWALFARLDTPFHMDAEAAQISAQAQNANACATVYQYEQMIIRAKAQLNNPAIPEWKKAELRNSIEDWQRAVNEIRKRYIC